jgi:hypothetical protein
MGKPHRASGLHRTRPPFRIALFALSAVPAVFAVFVVLAAVVSLPGCGTKSSPRPPEFVRPQTIDDLTARSVAQGIRLTWTRPVKTMDGRSMPDLDGFVVTRAVEEPATAPVDLVFEPIATLHLDDRGRFRKVRKVTYEDRTVVPGQRYVYRIVAFTLDRYVSAPSAPARARWRDFPPAAMREE